MQDFVGKDRSLWQKLSTFQAQRGRLQQQNIINIKPGPTACATTRVVEGRTSSSFQIMFSKGMLRNIQKCTISEAQHITGNANGVVTLEELHKFIRPIIARVVLGQRVLPCSSLWNTSWGCPMFNKTFFRDRFMKIERFLRFDIKSDRRRRLVKYRFCLASSLWNCFIENSQISFVMDVYLTVDEQLLPC